MNGRKRMALVAVVALALVTLGAACTNGSDEGEQPSSEATGLGAGTSGSGAAPQTSSGAEPAADILAPPQYAAATARSLTQAAGAQSEGIFVSGTGRVAVDPDLAILRLGIEVQDESVSAAHTRATAAMTAVSNAVKAAGVEDRDIQTQRFSIQPVYRYVEVVSLEGGRSSERVLDGYRVTNSVAVKVRDLDSVSTVIDGAAAAGGDDVRIDSISFTLEDPTDARAQARAEATRAAVLHARQIADAAGVALGKPISLSESGISSPVSSFAKNTAVAFAESAGPTPIEAGELEVVVTVSAVFAIP